MKEFYLKFYGKENPIMKNLLQYAFDEWTLYYEQMKD
jgi:hypothetical protein